MEINTLKLRCKQIAAISRKNMKIYYTEGPILIYGILFPFFLFLAFALGKNIPVKNLLPGLLGISFFFAGSSVGPFITPWETRTKTLERLLSSPGSISILVLGDILSGFIFSAVIAVLVIIVGVLGFGGNIVNIFSLIFVLFSGSLCFAALGTIFSALPTDKPANVMMLSNLVRLPLIFISGVFVPVSELPWWGQLLSRFSPVTYLTDLIRYSYGQEYFFSINVNILLLLVFTVIFLFLAIYLHQKTMTKRI